MPKSKKSKVYSLSNAHKKGSARKSSLLQQVRDCCDTFDNIYIFDVDNLSNCMFKELRIEWKEHSKFFFGKNKVMQLALGRMDSDEYKDNLHQISKHLKGNSGILFSSQPLSVVKKFFADYCKDHYATAGVIAPRTITLPEGPLDQFSHSMEPYLRSLGLPTSLERGKVTLLQDYTVCEMASILTPEQAKLMKLLHIKLGKFKMSLKCHWTKTGEVTLLDDHTQCHTSMITSDHEE